MAPLRMHGESKPSEAAIGELIVEDGVDLSLLRWMLSRTLEERLEVLQGFVDRVVELNGGTLPATVALRERSGK